MKIRTLFLALILLSIYPSFAQEAEEFNLEYGDIATAEITDREFEIEYTFEGSAGDVVIILVGATEDSDFDDPEILLLDPDFEVMSDTTSQYSFGDTIRLVSELPEDGEYIIIVTRTDGRAGDSVGEFILGIQTPEEITSGEVLTGETTSELGSQYFLVRPSVDSLVIYNLISGDYRPEIKVTTINESNSSLEELVVLSGDGLTYGALGSLEAAETYIITVGRAAFSYSFNEISAEFTLELSTPSDD